MALLPKSFNTEMVERILGGTKTQTRRYAKMPAGTFYPVFEQDKWWWKKMSQQTPMPLVKDPGEKAGDILYVRETFAPVIVNPVSRNPVLMCTVADVLKEREITPLKHLDNSMHRFVYRAGSDLDETFKQRKLKWTGSIHMPRSAARLFLLVKETKIHRLQDITEEDAKAEGVTCGAYLNSEGRWITDKESPRAWGFFALWDSIYGVGAHLSNPWVKATTFELIKRPKQLLDAPPGYKSEILRKLRLEE
jgi:hypothetical protein